MKLLVSKIPPEGMDISFTKGKEWLKEELLDRDELKGYIHESLECRCRVSIIGDQVFVDGEVFLKLRPVCFRCNKEFEKDFWADLNLTCTPDKRKKTLRGQDYMDGDVGFNYYAGQEIDLAIMAREQLFLTLPMTFLCKDDCPGLCMGCGADLNVAQCRCREAKVDKLK